MCAVKLTNTFTIERTAEPSDYRTCAGCGKRIRWWIDCFRWGVTVNQDDGSHVMDTYWTHTNDKCVARFVNALYTTDLFNEF